MPGPEDDNYYAAVESHFVSRRGSPLFITPREWDLVARWEAEGIPLHVVRDAIDRVFERPRASSKTRKLTYCRQSVEAAFRRFREGTLGRAPARQQEDAFDLKAYLEGLAASVRALPGSLSGTFPEAISSLASETDTEAIESALTEMDRRLLERAETESDETVRRELERDAERSLAAYRERMPEKVYRAAVTSGYRRRLRARWKLPRLTLLDR